MKEETNEILKWIGVILLFLGLVLLLCSVVSFPLVVHRHLYYGALAFFFAVLVLVVYGYFAHHPQYRPLSKMEKEALIYISKIEYIKAEVFTVLFGTDVYVFLLRRGYIEYWLIDKQPAVHCRISKKGLNKCKKIKI